MGEFARAHQRLVSEREELEDDILRDFEELKVTGGEAPPDETFVAQEASFRSTAVYKDLVLQLQQQSADDPAFEFQKRAKLEDNVSVLAERIAGPRSIFVTCEHKIDVESIYDNQSKHQNMTRFSQLPTKLQKTNMPVTFHKQIKSSGYGGAPDALKYSATQK